MEKNPWICEKCGKSNGLFERKCWNCGKKRPLAFTPNREEEEAFVRQQSSIEMKSREELDRLGNRMGLALCCGLVSATLVGAGWFLGNTGVAGPAPVMVISILVSVLYGSAVGGAVWFGGRGFSVKYGYLGAAFGLVSALCSQALIGTHFLGLDSGHDPAIFVKSMDFGIYWAGFKYWFHLYDVFFYILIGFSAWWFSWRNSPSETRLWLLGGH